VDHATVSVLLHRTKTTMRDIFSEMFSGAPIDPTEAARRSLRPRSRARFYAQAQVGEVSEHGQRKFHILLDHRPVRTPMRRTLAAPARPLAEAIAAEWEAQRELIDPARMPLTRLANAIIDGVATEPSPVAAEIANYLGSDLLFYRAAEPEGLVASQARHWDPVIDWARDALGARFVLAQGVVFVAQPAAAIAAATRAIPYNAANPNDIWPLGALSAVTTLTGSALLALALGRGRLTVDEAWAAAHVDEDWQMLKWGHDEHAMARREARFAEMQAAATVLRYTG
jgi:chaperone required for assembly of F1-ATPase